MIVSLTIVRYRKRYIPFALLAMAIHRLPLFFTKSCSFWKLMGSGKNGSFDLHPDWQQWALLAAWDREQDLKDFINKSFIAKWWNFFRVQQWTILCEPLSGHGKWDNREPFIYSKQNEYKGPIAVLTRATIRRNRLKNFWANVDRVAVTMAKSPGLIISLGIGEAPVFRQATFSLWENTEAMEAFAYHSSEHRDVIRKTRDEKWYSEELFARLKPVASFGAINGRNPFKI